MLIPESRVVPGAFVKADDLATSPALDGSRPHIGGVLVVLQIFFPLTLLFIPLAFSPPDVARDKVIAVTVLWRVRSFLRAVGVGRGM